MPLITSPNDHRRYQHITLQNGLRVLLVSDPTCERSTASLAVEAGQFHDPIEHPGMAHFVEHMLFLGTETFPKSGEYHAFINRHGGRHNAWTATEKTNYFFDIEHQFFAPALHRFSRFFVCPTLDAKLIEKERQAIESEFRLKIHDEARRFYQVFKESVNPAHPFARFAAGNLQTLADPKKGSIRKQLQAFIHRYYQAHRMTLVLYAKSPCTELSALAEQYFADIPSTNEELKLPSPPLFRPEDLGFLYQIKPLKELRKLQITFALPSMREHYTTKPLTFICHLLGDEGPRSLACAFKAKGWITYYNAHGGLSGYNFKTLDISIGLTAIGLEHYREIVQEIFALLHLIEKKGLNEWRYSEKQQVLRNAFRYQEKGKGLDFASQIAVSMHHYQTPHWLYGDYMMEAFDQQELRTLLAQFNPHNMVLFLTAPELETDRQCAWYDTPYQRQPIEQEWLAQLAGSNSSLDITLAEKNPFIETDLTPRPNPQAKAIPTCLIDKRGFRLWHLHDAKFKVPKGSIYVAVDSEHAVRSTRHIAMTRLAVALLCDHLDELTYPAEIAGLGYHIYTHQGGFTFNLSGFSRKLPLLLKQLLDNRIFGYPTPERFAAIKLQLKRSWSNQLRGRPINQLFNQLTSALQPNNPPLQHLLRHLDDIQHEELPEFVQNLYKAIHIEVLVHGDFLISETQAIAQLLEHTLTPNSLPSRETRRKLINLNQSGTLVHEVNCPHPDSALLVYHQSPHTHPRKIALFCFAHQLLNSPFFHELRTRQQLGYVVGTSLLPLNQHPGLVFYVQSPTSGPKALLQAIDQFIDSFPILLLEFNEQQWQESKQGLLLQFKSQDTNLRSRSQRLWISIGQKDLGFEIQQQIADQIATIHRSDLIRFMSELRSRQSDRLILCSYGQSSEHQIPIEQGTLIDDLRAFKLRSRKFYSL